MSKSDRPPWRRPHDPTMDLPAGKTCSDCSHFTACNLMWGHIAADEVCDWSPSRFRLEASARHTPTASNSGETNAD